LVSYYFYVNFDKKNDAFIKDLLQMEKNLINSDNWTHCHFAAIDQKALITIGADPSFGNETTLYFVTAIDTENNEVYQMQFNKLETACQYINKRYQKIWDFVDLTKKQDKKGGCSTCIAH
jgi:hypothetical protein